MPAPDDFVAKWSKIRQKETAVYASHFDDICRLVGHPTPSEYAASHDPEGLDFSFQTSTVKADGQKGFADVYFRKHFIWEYKGLHADLGKAYRQLQLYREALDNPPLLITSDIQSIHIHSNFTNRPTVETVVTFNSITDGSGVEILRRVFYEPESFQPDETREQITKATAETFLAVAETLKKHQRLTEEDYTPEQRAHFLIRLLFCLFAEDLNLLPEQVFTEIVKRGRTERGLDESLRQLFAAMRVGGQFGWTPIRYFDGTLFDDEFVPDLPHELAGKVLYAARQDWSAVDPSILGTLFERIIDEDKRAQLGAHYTSQEDIKLIVEPVLVEPLRRKWDEVRLEAERQLSLSAAGLPASDPSSALVGFANEIASTRVLDPACGSGNFLYVALRRLLDLQKEVIAYAARKGLPEIELTVGPEQLYGIEINEYAHELAQVTVWIGYLQWRFENGFADMDDPILRPLRNIKRMDAILAYDEDGRPVEPEWPAAEVIIGNPPFLGGNKIRAELGDTTVDSLFRLYDGRVPAFADLVCYWFEKARAQIELGDTQRAGLLATNSIRGGANRRVLERIKETGDIFMAWSDNPWVLDGAAVRVSIVGFTKDAALSKRLDGVQVSVINADLTSSTADLTRVTPLLENQNIAFQGPSPKASFDIESAVARALLPGKTNSNVRPNSDVVRPLVTAFDITKGSREMFTIDFGLLDEAAASKYELPFDYVRTHILPERQLRRDDFRGQWWQYARPRPEMRAALTNKQRFIATPRHSKHRVYVWLQSNVLANDSTIAFACDDDYFFGVLHSRPHELWALRMGTSLEDRPRYTPTTTFETFPFPWPPGREPAEADDPHVAEIAHWARELVKWRDGWLNPPAPAKGTIDVAYDRLLKARTLTNLYNGLVYYREHRGPSFDRAAFDKETRKSVGHHEIRELDDIHRALDAAVMRAYGWPTTLTDDEILERLLGLNLERAGRQ